MPATTCPSIHPELPEHELVSSSAALASSSFPGREQLLSLRIFGVSGSLKFICGGGDGVFGNNGHVEASSSGKNVEHDGDVFSDCTPNKGVLFVGISRLFIFSLNSHAIFTLVAARFNSFIFVGVFFSRFQTDLC